MSTVSIDPVGDRSGRPHVHAVGGEAPLRRDSLYLLISTALVGMGNYGFSLGAVWILRPVDFSEVASLSALLLAVGSASNASLPWVLTRSMTRHGAGTEERGQAIGFTLIAAIGCGLVAAVVVLMLSARYATDGGRAAAGATAFLIFLAGLTVGFCQGARRFVLLATLTVVEVATKFGVGLTLAAKGLGAAGAITGAALGAGVVVLVGVKLTWHQVRWPQRALVRSLGKDAARIGFVQVAVSLVVTMDILAGSIRNGHSSVLAGYQAITTFTRLPLFASIAISMVAYPRFAACTEDSRHFARVARDTTAMYLTLGAATAAVVATLPSSILSLVLPARYAASGQLLLPLSIAGFSAGLINLSATIFQARARARTPLAVLTGTIVIGAGVLFASASVPISLAWAAAALLATTALVLVLFVQHDVHDYGIAGSTLGAVAVAAAYIAVLRVARPLPFVWLAVAAVIGLLALNRTRLADRATASAVPASLGGRLSHGVLLNARLSRRLTDAVVRMARPLAPPSTWEVFVLLRSIVGDGPAVVVPWARRVLVLAPHPDDETLGCGGTLARLAEAGCQIRVLIASDGEASVDEPHAKDVARRRRLQGVAACEHLGAERPVFLGLPDTRVGGFHDELVATLTEEVLEFDPELIFVPWPLDAHVDHRSVALGLASVPLPAATEVWSYEVWTSLPANRLVDVSECWDAKLTALDCHALDDAGRDAHLALQRWRSLHGLSGRGYAEAFLVLSAGRYRSLVGDLLQ